MSTVCRVTELPGDPEDELHISSSHLGTAVVLTVTGEIDLNTAPELQDAILAGIAEAGSGLCVVDLTKVDFLGSAGLAALLEATAHAQGKPKPLRIVVDANRPVIRPIEVTGLDQVLALFHTVEEALAG
jgi:anti-sigma B factor antagonist